MKKYFIAAVLGLMLMFGISSCFHNHNRPITVWDDDDEYEMNESYQERKTHMVEVYLDEKLIKKNIVSLNRDGEDEIWVDDNTSVYINANPGELRIKIDKDKYSAESCEKLRRACEELKEILADR